MKVAYIFPNAGFNEDSVQKKIRQQLEALNNNGIDAEGIFFTTDLIKEEPSSNSYKYIQATPINKGLFRSLRERKAIIKSIYKWANNNAKHYNILYVRNYRPSYLWLKFIIKNKSKIVTEHQTLEEFELSVLSKENPFGWKPSKFLSWMEHNAIPWLNEMIFGGLVLGQTKNLVGVTNEIASYERNRAVFHKPKIHVVTNGIATNTLTLREPPIFDGSCLKMLMLVGGRTSVDWHGIDLIIKAVENYQGKCKIEIHLAGNNNILEVYNAPFVFHHGYCNKNQVDLLTQECHLALGTFAFERKGCAEASTLKMREYAARGIPAVYGHLDPDYETLVDMGLALRMPSMKPPDMIKIVEFANKIFSDSRASLNLREFAQNHLDYFIKMKELRLVLENSIREE